MPIPRSILLAVAWASLGFRVWAGLGFSLLVLEILHDLRILYCRPMFPNFLKYLGPCKIFSSGSALVFSVGL